jgi:predicted dehydrogenase
MIRLALIGCGEHSRTSHAIPLARYASHHVNEIQLSAACDLNIERAETFCREYGFLRAYSDLQSMLATESVDACVSVMPMESIVSTAVKLMQLRIPCVIEKPLGTSMAEAETLARVANETQTPHMVSVNRRFMPFLNRARAWTAECGPLQYVRATQVRHLRSEPDFIWSTGIHALDALRYLAGDIISFDCKVTDKPELSASWYEISLQFESGAHGRLEVVPTAGMVEESYELFGEGFRAQIVAGSGTQRSLRCWRNGTLEVEAISDESEPEDLRNGSYEEVVEFVNAMKSGRHPRPSVHDILPSAKICFSIADSTLGPQASSPAVRR